MPETIESEVEIDVPEQFRAGLFGPRVWKVKFTYDVDPKNVDVTWPDGSKTGLTAAKTTGCRKVPK